MALRCHFHPNCLAVRLGSEWQWQRVCVVGGYKLKLMLAKNIVKYNFREQKVKK